MDLGFGDGPVREAGVAGQPPPFFHVLAGHREVGWPGLLGLLAEPDDLAGLGEELLRAVVMLGSGSWAAS